MTPEQSGRPYAWWISRVGCWLIDAVVPAVLILVGYGIGRPTYSLQTQSINGVEYQVSVASGLHPRSTFSSPLLPDSPCGTRGFVKVAQGNRSANSCSDSQRFHKPLANHLASWRATLRCVLLVVDFALCYLGSPLAALGRQTPVPRLRQSDWLDSCRRPLADADQLSLGHERGSGRWNQVPIRRTPLHLEADHAVSARELHGDALPSFADLLLQHDFLDG